MLSSISDTMSNVPTMRYSIDQEKNIIHCKFNGQISADLLIEYIQIIRNDKNFSRKLNTIADIQDAIFSEGFLEVVKIIDYVNSTTRQRGLFRLAFITNGSYLDNTGANQYALLMPYGHAKICSDMTEALEWVQNAKSILYR